MRDLYEKWIRTPSLRGQLIWLNVSSVLVTLLISLLILVLLVKDTNVGGYAASDMQEYCNGGSGFRKQK